jgi:DNA-directed RNA polymerase subunit RPC12/RpoP
VSAGSKKRPLWRCPRCGHRFVTRNLWHSCVRVPLAKHFRGKPAERKKTWDRWLASAKACGRVVSYAQKSRIIIMARVRFAGAVVHRSYVDGGLWLRRRVDHPRLMRTEDYGRLGFGHHFRLQRPEDIDGALDALMREAYLIGIQQSSSQPATN